MKQAQILSLLQQLNRKIEHMTLNLDRLSADVAALNAAELNVLALLGTILAQQQATLAELTRVRADLAAAIAANDPAAQAAAQAQIDAIAAQLETGTQSLVDVVAANTPPAPAPVVEPAPAPVESAPISDAPQS